MGNQAVGGRNLFTSGLEQCSWLPSIPVSQNSNNFRVEEFLPFIRERYDVMENISEATSILTGIVTILLQNNSVSSN